MTDSIGFTTHGRLTGHSTLEGKELAIRDLRNHFATRRGERLGRPDFGSRLPEYLFEPMHRGMDPDSLDEAVEDEIRRVIGTDPRWAFVSHRISRDGHAMTADVEMVYLPDDTIELVQGVGSEAA